jgi:type I restriction enzyme S subunit
MQLKIYPKYKDSRIKWIEKIPEDWKVRKIKHFSKIFTGSTPESGNDAYWNGEIIWLTPLDLNNSGKFVSSSKRKITKEGFLRCGTRFINKGAIILATRAPIGYPKITNTKLCFNQGCKAFEIEKEFITDYCYYYFVAFEDILKSKGNATTFSELSTYELASFLVLKPPTKEQNIIAYLLDEKILKIDKLIEKDKKLIELLKEKRIALINQIVTKGLDPNAKMKDSGIEWIGEIPEGWKVKRLRFNALVNPLSKKALSNPKVLVHFLPMEKISEKGEYDNKSEAEYQNVSTGYTYFENNDVLVAKITPCFENGKGALVNDLKYGFGFGSTEFHIIRSYWHLIPKYLFYLTKTHIFRDTGEAFMEGTAGQKRVSKDFIKDFIMVTPPRTEQLKIVEYIDKAIAKIDKTIQKIEEKINLLEEYKKSLIHHVVTGKIDVREAV